MCLVGPSLAGWAHRHPRQTTTALDGAKWEPNVFQIAAGHGDLCKLTRRRQVATENNIGPAR